MALPESSSAATVASNHVRMGGRGSEVGQNRARPLRPSFFLQNTGTNTWKALYSDCAAYPCSPIASTAIFAAKGRLAARNVSRSCME